MTAAQHLKQAGKLRKADKPELAEQHENIAKIIEARTREDDDAFLEAITPQMGEDAVAWNESDHPRGQPGNKGQFGPGGGGRDPAAEGARAAREDDKAREAGRGASKPAAAPTTPSAPAGRTTARTGAYAGQYETSGPSPRANHLLTVSRVLSNPPNRGIHYRRMLAQLIREAPGFDAQSAIPSLKNKLVSALVLTHNALHAAGRTAEAERVVGQLRRLGSAPDSPAPASRANEANQLTPTEQARRTPPPPARRPETSPLMRQAQSLARPTPAAPAPPADAPRYSSTAQKLMVAYRSDVRARGIYQQHVKMDPDEFSKSLLGPLEARGMEIMPNYTGTGLTFRGNFPGGGSISRNFDFNTKTVDHAYLTIPPDKRKAGKQVLASQMALYKKLGMEKISVHANIDVGAYAWAKYGFVPKQSSWDELRRGLKLRVNAIQAGAKSATAKQKGQLAEINRLLDNRDPKTIWKVVDHPGSVSVNGKDTTVAKIIMTGGNAPHWYGTLNMKDPETMKRFESYVGKDA